MPNPPPPQQPNPTASGAPTQRRPVVLGILGGIASGKSTVAAEFAQQGFAVVDADEVAREVVASPEIIRQLRDAFGPGVLTPEGGLDRPALAQAAFANAQSREALDGITHPPIRRRLLELLEHHRSQSRDVLLDVPLLLESDYARFCDGMVFLQVPEAVREARAQMRGWQPGERSRREAHQTDLKTKEAAATWVIENGGDAANLPAQVTAIVASLPGPG